MSFGRVMPIITIALIFFISIFHNIFSLEMQGDIYALSIFLKDLILFALPFIIFLLLFHAAISVGSKVTQILGVILFFICLSNLIGVLIGEFVGMTIYNLLDYKMVPIKSAQEVLKPNWHFDIKPLISNSHAMLAGGLIGIFLRYTRFKKHKKILSKITNNVIKWSLKPIILCMPFFVCGYLIKLESENATLEMVRYYSLIFAIIASVLMGYIFLWFCIMNNFVWKNIMKALNNVAPVAINGFVTMSSAATLPLSIKAAKQMAKNKALVASIAPISGSIHMIGDCITIPILTFALMQHFDIAIPGINQCILFTIFFVISKFTIATVPGGGIVVALPLLATYMGFNHGMLSLITTLYILLDPIITVTNVLANNVFNAFSDKLISKYKLHK